MNSVSFNSTTGEATRDSRMKTSQTNEKQLIKPGTDSERIRNDEDYSSMEEKQESISEKYQNSEVDNLEGIRGRGLSENKFLPQNDWSNLGAISKGIQRSCRTMASTSSQQISSTA
jgi:hypothetical protein